MKSPRKISDALKALSPKINEIPAPEISEAISMLFEDKIYSSFSATDIDELKKYREFLEEWSLSEIESSENYFKSKYSKLASMEK